MPVTRCVGIASIRATPWKSFSRAAPLSQPFETSMLSHGIGASDFAGCRRHLRFTMFHSRSRSACAGCAAKVAKAAIANPEIQEEAAQLQILISSLQRLLIL